MGKFLKNTIIKIKRGDKERTLKILNREGIHVFSDMYFVLDWKNLILGFILGAIIILILA